MPAPTALLRRPEELADGANVPLSADSVFTTLNFQNSKSNISTGQDDELLLSASDTVPSNLNVIPAAGDADTEMHIDEEGRPRFAPAKNTVRRFSI